MTDSARRLLMALALAMVLLAGGADGERARMPHHWPLAPQRCLGPALPSRNSSTPHKLTLRFTLSLPSAAKRKRSKSRFACGPRSHGQLCRSSKACCAKWVRAHKCLFPTGTANLEVTCFDVYRGCPAPRPRAPRKAASLPVPVTPTPPSCRLADVCPATGHVRHEREVLRQALHQRSLLAQELLEHRQAQAQTSPCTQAQQGLPLSQAQQGLPVP